MQNLNLDELLSGLVGFYEKELATENGRVLSAVLEIKAEGGYNLSFLVKDKRAVGVEVERFGGLQQAARYFITGQTAMVEEVRQYLRDSTGKNIDPEESMTPSQIQELWEGIQRGE